MNELIAYIRNRLKVAINGDDWRDIEMLDIELETIQKVMKAYPSYEHEKIVGAIIKEEPEVNNAE